MSEDELREAMARKLSTWVIGNMPENSWLCADALLAGPLAPLLAKVRAVEAAIADYDEGRNWSSQVVDRLRTILDGESRG